MTTKGQELKKELAQSFPGLKFSVKTDKGITTRIDVIVTGLMGSSYTMSEIKLVTNKYHNYRTHGHNDSHTGNTQVHVKNERLYYLKEIKEMVPNYESNWSTVYKIADNECFTVLPDGYYEEKMSLQNPQSQEVIDSAVTEIIEEETIDDTVVETVKEANPQNKVAKLQAKLNRLQSQLKITKGNRNKAKLVLEILKIELGIEQSEPIQKKPVEVKREIKQSKPVDTPVDKKDEFCKKAEKTTIKFLESKFKDAQIDITDKQIILKSETSELKLNCFVEIPYIDEYYNHYRRKKLIKRLRDGQTSKAHSVCEYIGSILLAA